MINVIIYDYVWVGCNATILKGVTIGRGAVVAAAVVTKDVRLIILLEEIQQKLLNYALMKIK